MDPKLPNESGSSESANPSPHAPRRPWKWWLEKLMTPVLTLCVGTGLIAALGLAQRTGWFSPSSVPTTVPGAPSSEEATYTCPMHPQIRQPESGRCPICGMELVPATASGGEDLDELSVRIDPAQRRLANIETAPTERNTVNATIRSVGAIAIDESRMATIASYTQGRIERLFADYTGVQVADGDHLAVVYSPELYSAQVDYLESKKTVAKLSTATLDVVRTAHQRLAENSRQRLIELGMTTEQLATLDKTGSAKSRLTIYTPIAGTVIEKMAVEGKYVDAGEPIYRIADLSTVWLMLQLYPEDASRIRFGQRVKAEIQSLPGESFEGRVAFIDPTVDPRQRTVGVRVEFLNEDRRLRPGDYATANIFLPIGETGEVYDSELAGRWISPMHPQIIRDEPGPCPICGMDLVPTSRFGYSAEPVEQPESLTVPRSAVLMAGTNSVVYVEVEPGRFEIRPVTLGPILRDRVVILKGLRAGEQVATAGNFLIDSQMQLAGKPSLIDPTRAVAQQPNRNTPLEFEHVHISEVDGLPGIQLEELYAAYFAIQQSLAEDAVPTAEQSTQLHELAKGLTTERSLPQPARSQLAEIVRHSEHLHHLSLKQARLDSFRPLSHAVVTLATQVRGSSARQPLTHLFCPMVPGGEGDWLQPGGEMQPHELRNPYWGATMLNCGEVVRELSMTVDETGRTAQERQHAD